MGAKGEEWFTEISITFTDRYSKVLYEPALMFAAFGYREALFGGMVECALQSDYPVINMLYCSTPLFVEVCRGLLTVRNYNETEGVEKGQGIKAGETWLQ